MSSIIVLDSSDEEVNNADKNHRTEEQYTKNNQSLAVGASMARVNPVNIQSPMVKKQTLLPTDNFKIHLPGKRPISKPFNDQVPEKRVKRIKTTTVVRTNDGEYINRDNTGSAQMAISSSSTDQNTVNISPTMSATILNKTAVNSLRSPMRAASNSPTPASASGRSMPNTSRVVVSPVSVSANHAKDTSTNYVRIAWNGKDPKHSPTLMSNRNLTVCVKEQPQTSVISKGPTASSKDQSKALSLSPPIFNKNSVTIRRVLIGEDKSKTPTQQQPAKGSSMVVTKSESGKSLPIITNVTTTANIRKIQPETNNFRLGNQNFIHNKNANNSSLRITQVTSVAPPASSTPPGTVKKIPLCSEVSTKVSQSLSVVKRNLGITTNSNCTESSVTSTIPQNTASGPTTIRKVFTVDSGKPKTYSPAKPKTQNVTLKSMTDLLPKVPVSMPMSSGQNATSLKSVSLTTHSKLSPLMNCPSGLIVTPITSSTAPTVTTNSATKHVRIAPSASRRNTKQAEPTIQVRPDQTLLTPPLNPFPPSGYTGSNPTVFDLNHLSGSTFINPPYSTNRTIRPPDQTPFPMFNLNYPSFSGGSITPVSGAPSLTNSSRASKSPVSCTLTKSANATRSSAGFANSPIDVGQNASTPMSPPVFNVNQSSFNGDSFNFLRSGLPQTNSGYSLSTISATPNTNPTNKPTVDRGQPTTPSASPGFHKDLDDFVKNPQNYPRCITSNAPGNSPSNCNDTPESRSKNQFISCSPIAAFKSPVSTKTSPTHSSVSEVSSVSEFFNQAPVNGDHPKTPTEPNSKESGEKETQQTTETNAIQEVDEMEPITPEYETLLKACRDADSSDDMNKLIKNKLIRYYYSVHPDFVKSRGFRKAIVTATENINKNPDLVYYHLRPVVEEMKARKKCRSVVMTNEASAAASPADGTDGGDAERIRNKQIRRLNKALYILTRKINKMEIEEVDLEDENSSYQIVERLKKRACKIYDKICDLTGESRHALRQVKKPITFKETDYPRFNKVVETFVNRTKEFPDFFDVLRMLEFCNDRYNFGLLKEEMTMIAQDAFIKIGKLLQNRRRADLYETVSHFTADLVDPADNDALLSAKLSENEKFRTSIGSIIDKYAREQVKRKSESANVTEDESHNTMEISDSSDDDDETKTDETNKQDDEKCEDSLNSQDTKTNGTLSPHSTSLVSPSLPSPTASTSAAFTTVPPHAFISPQASPRLKSPSPNPLPLQLLTSPSSSAADYQQERTSPIVSVQNLTQSWPTNTLKIISVTSLSKNSAGSKAQEDKGPGVPVDEIVISDEDS